MKRLAALFAIGLLVAPCGRAAFAGGPPWAPGCAPPPCATYPAVPGVPGTAAPGTTSAYKGHAGSSASGSAPVGSGYKGHPGGAAADASTASVIHPPSGYTGQPGASILNPGALTAPPAVTPSPVPHPNWGTPTALENFDTHSRHFTKMKERLLPPVDRAFSALLEDLTQRGMLDETLVAWTGEFGRTPRINGSGGRDHWGRVYSTVLAGGGVRGGRVVGRSDAQGAVPADNPVHASDFVATMYHALGYGSETRVTDQPGRPHFVVQGRPLLELF